MLGLGLEFCLLLYFLDFQFVVMFFPILLFSSTSCPNQKLPGPLLATRRLGALEIHKQRVGESETGFTVELPSIAESSAASTMYTWSTWQKRCQVFLRAGSHEQDSNQQQFCKKDTTILSHRASLGMRPSAVGTVPWTKASIRCLL